MASAVTHTDKTTTPLTNYTQLLFYSLLSLHLIRSYFSIYFPLRLTEVVLLFLTLLLVNQYLCKYYVGPNSPNISHSVQKIARNNVEISLKNSLKIVLKIYDRYRNSKLTNLIIDGAVFYRRESLEPALYSLYKTQKPIKII